MRAKVTAMETEKANELLSAKVTVMEKEKANERMRAKLHAKEKASNVLWDAMKNALFGAIG